MNLGVPENDAKQVALDLISLLDARAGRHVMAWLIYDVCMLEGPSYEGAIKDGGSSERYTEFREGVRAVGADLKNAIRYLDPGHWELLEAERNRMLAAVAMHAPNLSTAGET
jgi:hypothetical protein